MRIVIAEDQVLLREGMARLFTDAGHEVLASLGSGDGLTEVVEQQEPDLVVLDIRMPPTFTDEGARAAQAIKTGHPETGVLLLSQHIETTHAVALVRHGGFGYLLKDRVLDVDDFLGALDRIAKGGSALDPEVVSRLIGGGTHTVLETLTAREKEVLALMAQGLANSGIAKRLWLSARTVETHVANIMIKLGLDESADDNRRVLAVLAFLRG